MELDASAQKVKSVRGRHILNSHLGITNEFSVRLENGNVGVGTSPQGETIGVYEDRSTRADVNGIIKEIGEEQLMERAITQADFDRYLLSLSKRFGRNNCWALSLAFFNAAQFPSSRFWVDGKSEGLDKFPRLCLNVLNGGRHAYTNPVLSDFPEYLLVPRFDDVRRVLRDHAVIQSQVRESLKVCERVEVGQNRVHRFKTDDNRECLSFLQGVLDRLGLSEWYDMMIDASAGDFRSGEVYRFSLTDKSARTTNELRDYWTGLIDEFDIGFLEDPFGEQDHEGWKGLTASQSKCRIIGDNLYSSDAERIEHGARNGLTNGAIIKPNQAGTVSAVRKAIEVCHQHGQIAITSHRSISTESTFLASVTVLDNVRYMKIGPLLTDYTSVMRFNELVRLTGVELE
jgi:enolase